MPRPHHSRSVYHRPPADLYKPAGIPVRGLEEVEITVDELEAIRLADFAGLYQEQVAAQMGVSRQTVGRILQSARQKVAQALAYGMALRITGGVYNEITPGESMCAVCGWAPETRSDGGVVNCPQCGHAVGGRVAGCGRGGRGRRGGRGGCGRGWQGGTSLARECDEADEFEGDGNEG